MTANPWQPLSTIPCRRLLQVGTIGFLLALGGEAALAGDPVGWRTDGSGSYPKAQPPLEWSPTKNVVWCTTMPGYGVSHPVLLGERLFICSEPATLLCLDKANGKVLWQKTCNYSEIEVPPDQRKQFEMEQEQTAELNRKQAAVQKEMDTLSRTLQKDKAPREEVDAKLKPFRTQIEDLKKEKLKLTVFLLYTQPNTHPTAGYSAPTPVTDGKEVFVVYGNGLVACYDLDGNRKWLKLIEHSNLTFAHSGSPVLAGGRLLVHFTDLVGLDPKTGNEVWRLQHPASYGTPLPARIGDVDVVFTPRGAMVRAQDGKVLADKLGSCGANSPTLHEGVVYYGHGTALAYRLKDLSAEPGKPPVMWKGKVKPGGYGFCSPVVHDGLLYASNDQGILSVVDAATGQTVYEERLNLGGSIYPSISAAGKYVYVSSDNGTTAVLQPGREFKELARNKLEPFRSSLVFEAKRMYVRTEKKLYCIGE
jgi:outer membrane protein assembly factor BamB